MSTNLLNLFKTGHAKIDEDHCRMAKTIEMTRRAIDAGATAIYEDLLRLFMRSAADHFAREEQWLRELGYPDIETHAAFHAKLLEGASQLIDMYCGAPPDRMREGFDKLVAFFVEDVVHGDHVFVSWLQEMGLAEPPLPWESSTAMDAEENG